MAIEYVYQTDNVPLQSKINEIVNYINEAEEGPAVSNELDTLSSTHGAFLVRGPAYWEGLLPGALGTILMSAGAGDVPFYATFDALLDQISAAEGDMLVRGAAGWEPVVPGAAGEMLTSQGAGNVPIYTAPPPGTVTSIGIDAGSSLIAVANSPVTTAGDIDLSLPLGAGTLVGNLGGAPAEAGAHSITAVLDALIGNTQGSIIYRSAAGWVDLGPGTLGFVLQTGGPGSDPAWGPAGTGTVTSVDMSVPVGLSISGNPVTTSGTLAVTWTAGYQGFTTVEAGQLATLAGSTNLANIIALTDPGADRALFWDDSVGAIDWLTYGATFTITGTSIQVTTATTGQAGAVELATAAEYRSDTAGSLALTPEQVWDAAECAVLTDGANIAVNLAAGFDFGGAANAVLALGGNRALSAPSSAKSGQKGVLWFGATGGTRTLTLNAAWVLCAGVETGPYSITTAQIIGLCYAVRGTTVYVTAILRQG